MRSCTARFNGQCTGCGRPWKQGATITRAPSGRWVHHSCYEAALAIAIRNAPPAAPDPSALPAGQQHRRTPDRTLADTSLHQRITASAGGAPTYL